MPSGHITDESIAAAFRPLRLRGPVTRESVVKLATERGILQPVLHVNSGPDPGALEVAATLSTYLEAHVDRLAGDNARFVGVPSRHPIIQAALRLSAEPAGMGHQADSV